MGLAFVYNDMGAYHLFDIPVVRQKLKFSNKLGRSVVEGPVVRQSVEQLGRYELDGPVEQLGPSVVEGPVV